MTHVFISYARSDEAIARELEQALLQEGFSTFLDQSPENGIAAGTDWLDELHRALARTGCLVYLSSAASASSAWCRAELLNAYWAGKVIIPVAIDDTEPPLSQRVQAVRLTKPLSESITRIVELVRPAVPVRVVFAAAFQDRESVSRTTVLHRERGRTVFRALGPGRRDRPPASRAAGLARGVHTGHQRAVGLWEVLAGPGGRPAAAAGAVRRHVVRRTARTRRRNHRLGHAPHVA